MTTTRVLSVGQCGYDHGRLARFLRDTFGTHVEPADTADEALDALRAGSFVLVLVNRVLDGDGLSGLELVRAIKADPSLSDVPTMLVSNYAEAQEQAISLGAVPGFGKADLGRPRSLEVLVAVLNPSAVQRPDR
jgi:two-component system chemotaxis response regulator CheY